MKIKVSMVKRINKLVEIPERNYQGYIWLSNETKPIVLNNEKYEFDKVGINPFVIEALLYDSSANISIHVSHSDSYHIYEYNLNDLPEGYQEKKYQYLSHRVDNFQFLKFKQIWVPEKDEYCEDMLVLKMKAKVFNGFSNS